jgi:hypothetical protein
MDWARILAFVPAMVGPGAAGRNEYTATRAAELADDAAQVFGEAFLRYE